MRLPRLVLGTLLVVLCVVVIGFGVRLAVGGSGRGLCGNDLIQADSAPAGDYEVLVFVRGCGATTTFATHVSIQAKGAGLSPDQVGNVLAIAACCADPRSASLVRNPAGGPLAAVRWTARDTLAIAFPDGVRIFHQVLVYRGVQIRYSAID